MADVAPAVAPEPAPEPEAAPVIPAGPITTTVLLEAWSSILESVQKTNRMAWIVSVTAQVRELDGDVLTIVFPTEKDAASFRPQPGSTGGVHEILRDAIKAHVGVSVKFRLSVEGTPTASIPTASVPTAPEEPAAPKPSSKREFATPEPVADDGDWNVVSIPGSEPQPGPKPETAPTAAAPEPEPEVESRSPQYGEAVVRQILGATLIAEENTAEIDIVVSGIEAESSMTLLDEEPVDERDR